MAMDRLNLTWIALVALTVASALLGRLAQDSLLPLVGLLLAGVKGQLVVDVFMGLRRAPRLWRGLLSGYLAVLVTALAALYLLAEAG
mgnify:CR=1 FL=1